MSIAEQPGTSAIATKGWLSAHKWLLLRRSSQLTILLVFLIGPWFGIWIIKGNLASSLILGVVPLSDPYVLLQSLFAGHKLAATALSGGAIVLAFYLLFGGRLYCSWVCPVNVLTDAATWLRRRLQIKGGAHFSRNLRYWVLAMTLVVAMLSGSLAWELINPVSMFHRGVIFGIGLGWLVLLSVFLFDLFISREGWCGHLCPVGAFYSLLGKAAVLRISAAARERCDDCMDCFIVCPERQVIKPALKGAAHSSPIIISHQCTNCGRCIDVCARDVFKFSTRFNTTLSTNDSKVARIKEVIS